MSMLCGFGNVPTTALMQDCYDYVGPAPQAHGGSTAKTMESLSRLFEFSSNRKKLSSFLNDEMKMNDGPNGTPEYALIKEMINSLTRKWDTQTQQVKLNNIIQNALLKPASALMKAKQTLSFSEGVNNPGRWEFNALTEMLKYNLKDIHELFDTLQSYCIAIVKLLKLDKIYVPRYVENEGKSVIRWEESTKEDMIEITCCINTMLKTGERGKLERRMIASPTMLVRPFVLVVEEICVGILKDEPSSVIQVGGEEKKEKMEELINSCLGADLFAIISGDITKWNECLTPTGMGNLLIGFFENMKGKTYINQVALNMTIMIVEMAFAAFANKNVLLGEGIPMKTKSKLYTYIIDPIEAMDYNLNEETRKHYDNVPREAFLKINFPLSKVKRSAVKCQWGMLMGMFNVTSTLYAVEAIEVFKHAIETNHKQSSDDFERALIAMQGTFEDILHAVEYDRLKWKMAGINISPEKTLIALNTMVGELTSSYHDIFHWGNLSTELPGIVPQGVDPYTDMTLGMNFLHAIACKNSIENPTISFAIQLFHRMYYYVYDVKVIGGARTLNELIREKYGENVMSVNGGRMVFSPSTVGINEMALRAYPQVDIVKQEALLPIDDEYLQIVMTPDVAEMNDTYDFLVEGKRPYTMRNTMPYNIFTYETRKNERVTKRKGMIAKERECFERSKKIKLADNTFNLTKAKGSGSVSQIVTLHCWDHINRYKTSGGEGADDLMKRLKDIVKKYSLKTGVGELDNSDKATTSSVSMLEL